MIVKHEKVLRGPGQMGNATPRLAVLVRYETGLKFSVKGRRRRAPSHNRTVQVLTRRRWLPQGQHHLRHRQL